MFSTADDIEATLVSIVVTLSRSVVLASSSVSPNPCMSDCNSFRLSDAVVNTSSRITICLDIPPKSCQRTREAAEPWDCVPRENATIWKM